MENRDLIYRIRLMNFRCHTDGDIGPFTRLNLIFGRNGSGKTSLLEAIEIAFTGSSYRVEKGDNLKEVIASDAGGDVSIKVLGVNNEEIVRFHNDRSFPTCSNLLKSFYGIKTDGRKARFLLPAMFSTHNLLYSERISQFLGADERDQLTNVLTELTMGRVVLETWNYLSKANKTLSSIYRGYREKFEQNRMEIEEIKKSIDALGVEDTNRLQALARRLESNLPHVFWNEYKPQCWEASSHCLTTLRDVAAKLKQAREHAIALQTFFELHDKPAHWGAVENIVSDMKDAREQAERELEALIGNQKSVDDKIESLEKDEAACLNKLKETESELNELAKGIKSANYILDWVLEIAAREKELAQIKSVEGERRELAYWEQALQLSERIPEAEQQRELEIKITNLRKEESEIKKKLDEIKIQRESYQRELEAVEQRLVAVQTMQERLRNLATQLHLQLKEIFELRPSEICPACGQKWPSSEDLQKAIGSHLTSLLAEMGAASGEVSQDVSSKARLQKKWAELDELDNRYRSKLIELNQQMGQLQNQQVQTEAQWHELKRVLTELGFELASPQGDDLSDQLDSLDRRRLALKVEELRRSLAQSEIIINQIWSGLRKEEFKVNEQMIADQLLNLEKLLSSYNLTAADKWVVESWKRLLKSLKMTQEKKQEKKQALDKDLANSRKEVRALTVQRKKLIRQIDSAKNRFQAAERKLYQWHEALHHAEVLISWDLVKVPEPIDTSSLVDYLAGLNQQVEAFSGEMLSQMKAMEQRTSLDRRLEQRLIQQRRNSHLLETTHELTTRFEALRSPETFERDKWNEYGDVISNTFKKLHWPPDYDGVYLSTRKECLDLEVGLREAPGKLVAAHKRLSAGQRAALAVSVFWAFNAIPQEVAPILLMDEPVQSIDDMNILNFLDGLRWFLEGADRQVFLTTANRRIQGLIRRKFSYLKNNFLELRLIREEGLSTLEYWNWKGERIDSAADFEQDRNKIGDVIDPS